MTKKTVDMIIDILEQLYPDAQAELDFNTPFELLIAVILSAQCTDVRVNQVTKILFGRANDAKSLSQMDLVDIEEIIKPCGLYKTKAANIKRTSELLVEKYAGEVPSEHNQLTELPGVGRKTANVVVSNAFDTPAIAVDTHVFRVSNRIGLANAANVDETERQLMKGIRKERWTKAHHMLIFHGRRVCKARNPNCGECPINAYCKYYKNNTRGKRV